jgi:hypothetical protein
MGEGGVLFGADGKIKLTKAKKKRKVPQANKQATHTDKHKHAPTRRDRQVSTGRESEKRASSARKTSRAAVTQRDRKQTNTQATDPKAPTVCGRPTAIFYSPRKAEERP